jgi:hypothetical protein
MFSNTTTANLYSDMSKHDGETLLQSDKPTVVFEALRDGSKKIRMTRSAWPSEHDISG